jgi:hypothetical protein
LSYLDNLVLSLIFVFHFRIGVVIHIILEDKWPKLHRIIISSLLLGQFLTGLSFSLKGNIAEGMVIGFCIIPTLIYDNIILSMFLRTYRDGGLLQIGRVHYDRRRSSRSISSHMEREGTKMTTKLKLCCCPISRCVNVDMLFISSSHNCYHFHLI